MVSMSFVGLIFKPWVSFTMFNTLWLWTDVEIARGRKVKGMQKPGPKPMRRRR
jgi:hypothetical protein